MRWGTATGTLCQGWMGAAPCQPAEREGCYLPRLQGQGEAPFVSVNLSQAGVETPREGETAGAVWGTGYGWGSRGPPARASLASWYTLIALGDAAAHRWPCPRKSGSSFTAGENFVAGLHVCMRECNKKELEENNAVQNKSKIHYRV